MRFKPGDRVNVELQFFVLPKTIREGVIDDYLCKNSVGEEEYCVTLDKPFEGYYHWDIPDYQLSLITPRKPLVYVREEKSGG